MLAAGQALCLIDLVATAAAGPAPEPDVVQLPVPAPAPAPRRRKAPATDPLPPAADVDEHACSACGRSFRSAHALRIHNARSHPAVAPAPASNPPGSPAPVAQFPSLGPIGRSPVDVDEVRARAAAGV